MSRNKLIHQIGGLKMEPGKADEYIAHMMKLRDRLYAVNYPIIKISLNDYLVQRLSEEWDTLKTTMRGLTLAAS